MFKDLIIIDGIEIERKDDTQFEGTHNGVHFKIRKDYDVLSNEFQFMLDVEKQNRLCFEGNFPSIQDCLKQI